MSYIQRTAEERWYLRLHDLAPYRAREILLVSSLYDAFALEEDGRLTSRLFSHYSELNLSQAPRITHAATATRALALLEQRAFDMVITMVRLSDMNVWALAHEIKEKFPRIPVVLLTFLEGELLNAPKNALRDIDRVFLWTGDARVFMAATKLLEDSRNIDHDTQAAGVRCIIVVEDSVRRYSSFLGMLYTELLSHSSSLIAEGLNDLHRLMRMRARPKLLLATNFEEALSLYRRYAAYVSAVISDVAFPRDEVERPDKTAGLELARIIREKNPTLPLLLQSAEPDIEHIARELDVGYANKNSPDLLRQIRSFLREGLGFGDFVFRLPDYTEVARAQDALELEEVLGDVPGESLRYHASRHDFSKWVMARSMYRLAEYLGAKELDDFPDIETLRHHLIEVLREERERDKEGAITDFSAWQGEAGGRVLRIGEGSMGGKGRGLAFVNHLMVRHGMFDRFDGLQVGLPKTVLIGTEEFERFVEESRLATIAGENESDQAILHRFLEPPLPESLVQDLIEASEWLDGPLAVRSSSLLEDSHLLPFAGIYATYILPNNHPDPGVRLDELCRAIKAIYASTYSSRARSYIKGTPYAIGEEKMAIAVQQLAGQRYGQRFYPHFSGVACSSNYYPVAGQEAHDGVVALALGLGHMVVGGGAAVQFSPAMPRLLPQYPTAREFLDHSQTRFYALDLTRPKVDFFAGHESSLGLHELAVAEDDGTLAAVGSVYVPGDDSIRDSLKVGGPRVVTFNNVLKWESVPLAAALSELLQIVRQGLGQEVEIEFAVDMGDWGRHTGRGGKARRRLPRVDVVQIRPQAGQAHGQPVRVRDNLPAQKLLCRTDSSLGHGLIEDIRDVVYVRVEALEDVSTSEVARQVGRINDALARAERPFLLIGPGRWGSSDKRLGIPVSWSQIYGARVIVETRFDGRAVDPSQGSHFFHNITSRGVGYLTLDVSGRGGSGGGSGEDGSGPPPVYDREWLDGQAAEHELSAVRHVRLPNELGVYLDGRSGKAAVLKRRLPGDSGSGG